MRENRGRRAIVLDTSAFIAGFDPFAIADPVYTVPSVRQELVSNSMIYTRFKTAIESGKLQVRTPGDAFLSEVDKSSRAVGDVRFLSGVDKQVLALAFELQHGGENPLVVTDDYSIQNLASILNIKYQGIAQDGITETYKWKFRCKGCGRYYDEMYETCMVCGSDLKTIRKSSKKQ